MLKALADFASTIDLPPRMYALTPVSWDIELDLNGKLLNVSPQLETISRGKKEVEVLGKKQFAPHISRNAGKAKLLTDTAEYVLGLGPDAERAARYFHLFRELVQQCFDATQEPLVRAVIKFLANDPLGAVKAQLERYPAPSGIQLEQGQVIAFLVDEEVPTELPSVKAFWADYIDRLSSENLPVQKCLVTGKVAPIVGKIEYKVKGVPDTQASGASLVSAYCDSFQSFGLEQALNSPISAEGVERFSQAIAHLINTDEHRLRIGSVLYLFWGARDFNKGLLEEPSLIDVEKLLQWLQTGSRGYATAEDFYVLVLSGGGGRVIVRDFLQTTIRDINENLARWFQSQKLYGLDGQIGKPLGIYQLAATAYRDPAKELQTRTLTSLSSAALQGGRIPRELLQKVITRIRIEGSPNYRQAILVKLILNSLGVNLVSELDNRMESLSKDSHKIAYCCGRLMATFEAIQIAALGKEVGANVSEKSYAAAATTPSRIFGRLGSGAINHLSTLSKNKGAAATALEKRLQEIYNAMPSASFPNTFSLEEQGIFDIGYWHEKAANAKASKENWEAKQNKKAESPENQQEQQTNG